jgi:uncharacterized glyoxalase superfamily protein PhnB
LIVADAAATIAFLKTVFGATPLRRHERPDGSIMHAEVRIDDTVVMIADRTDGWEAMPAHVHVYVADVDATFAKAVAAGGISVMPPAQKADEDRRGGVTDPGGTTWWIATEIGTPPASKPASPA